MPMHGFENLNAYYCSRVAEHTGYAREGKRRARLGKLLLQRSTSTVGMLYRFWYVTGLAWILTVRICVVLVRRSMAAWLMGLASYIMMLAIDAGQ